MQHGKQSALAAAFTAPRRTSAPAATNSSQLDDGAAGHDMHCTQPVQGVRAAQPFNGNYHAAPPNTAQPSSQQPQRYYPTQQHQGQQRPYGAQQFNTNYNAPAVQLPEGFDPADPDLSLLPPGYYEVWKRGKVTNWLPMPHEFPKPQGFAQGRCLFCDVDLSNLKTQLWELQFCERTRQQSATQKPENDTMQRAREFAMQQKQQQQMNTEN